MSIVRAPRPESNFYLLDKKIIEDCSLSWAARGLLVYLLGKPDHWNVSVAHLRKETAGSEKPTGRDGVYSLLGELIKAGYVVREQDRKEGGKHGETHYIVSERPLPAEPDTAQPLPAQPYPANPTQVSIEYKQKLNVVKTLGASAPSDETFEAAWAAYPSREGANPPNKARSSWNARIQEGVTPEQMMAGVMRYAAFCKVKGSAGTSYVMQGVRFFGKERAFDLPWAVSVAPSSHHGLRELDYGNEPEVDRAF